MSGSFLLPLILRYKPINYEKIFTCIPDIPYRIL